MPQIAFTTTEENESRIAELLGKRDAYNEYRVKELEDKKKTHTLNQISKTLKEVGFQTIKPFGRALQVYNKERLAGRALVAKGISTEKQSLLSRMKNIGFGTLQYVLSPIEAVAKAGVEEPISEAMMAAGIPEEISKFSGKMGKEAVYFIPPGATVRQMMMSGKPGLRAAQEIGELSVKKGMRPSRLTEEVVEKRIQARKEIKEAVVPSLETKGPLKDITKPQIKQGLIDDITEASVQALKGEFDDSQRIFRQIGEKLALGEINAFGAREVLQKHSLSPAQFAKMYEQTVSFAGRTLGYHSRAKRQLMDAFKDSPEALALFDKFYKDNPVQAIDKIFGFFGKAGNVWRASLVSQVATSMRNAWSQAGRLTISSLDEALQGVIKKAVGGEEKFVGSKIGISTLSEIERDMTRLFSALKLMKPKAQNKLFDVLDANHATLSKMRLFSQAVHEVSLGGKYAQVINTLNRTQEFFFRRIAFEAKTRQLLKRKGLDFNTIDPKNIPEGMLEEAVNYSLEMTFAASPKSKAMQKFVRNWTNSPMILINPFPRFAFGNALRFIGEHSPLGYLNAVKPSTLKALAQGNVDEFAKAASRATIGSLMLDSAMRIRQSKYAGEKSYQIKVSENKETGETENIDLRAYAPLTTPLFVAEMFVNPQRLKPADYVQAAIGLNRIAGTGLVFVDWLRAKTGESLLKQGSNFVGQHIASWLTPARTVSDFYSGIDPEESIYRDWRENPILTGPLSALPKISQMVPEKPSFMKSERLLKGESVEILGKKISGGVFRQLTGITKQKKTIVQREVDRLTVEWNAIAPNTGIPEADRIMARDMGPLVEQIIPNIIKRENYTDLSLNAQKDVLITLFQEIKSQARRNLNVKRPDLAIKIHIKNMPERREKLLEEIMSKQGEQP